MSLSYNSDSPLFVCPQIRISNTTAASRDILHRRVAFRSPAILCRRVAIRLHRKAANRAIRRQVDTRHRVDIHHPAAVIRQPALAVAQMVGHFSRVLCRTCRRPTITIPDTAVMIPKIRK